MNAWWPATGPSDVKESYNLPYYEWYQANKVAQILFCKLSILQKNLTQNILNAQKKCKHVF
jgi:hypothetical protein